MTSIRPAFFLFLGLAVVWAVYQPGLTGTFLFDDYWNLNAFSEMRAGMSGVQAFLMGVTRPVSFLSFFINDTAWPSNPEGFLYTNILLHMLVALLLVWLFFRVSCLIGLNEKDGAWIAGLSGIAWALHPLFVSTTLYIVQRMTILSALFTIVSLLSYVAGRHRLYRQNGTRVGWVLLTLAVPFWAVIGVLSKQNAALIPLFLLLFEHILFRNQKIPIRAFTWWRGLYIYLPLAVMLAGIFIFYSTWSAVYDIRHFSMWERLLTQPRVLVHYLYLLLIPRSSTNGLHNENFPVSTSLVEPWTTLPAVILIVGLVILTFGLRRRLPVLSMAVGFFLAGHLLESTFLALEMYYEHRNYLPSIFLFFALGYYLFKIVSRFGRIALTVPVLVLLAYGGTSWARTNLWGNPLLMMAVWTENNPGSARNYAEAAVQANKLHRRDLAKQFIEKGSKRIPDEVHLLIGKINYACQDRDLTENDIADVISLLKTTKQARRVYLYRNLEMLLGVYRDYKCDPLSYEKLREMLLAALGNESIERYNVRQQEFAHLLGILELYAGDNQSAVKYFRTSLDLNPNPDTALTQIAILASHEQYELAMAYLKDARMKLYGVQSWRGKGSTLPYGASDFNDLEGRLTKALGATAPNDLVSESQ